MQFQTHWENNTIWLCHTSCDILNAGTLESYLITVTQWLRQNPYDVLTILMGNSDFIGVGNYSSPIESSGLIDYVYTPPRIPMGVNDWPTLSSMILSGKRVVVFLDYQANQTEVPYVIDEFGNMFETPFSPTDRNFPCTVQRPPNLPADQAEDRLYMANHNLNLEVSFAGINLLIPNSALLDETNGVSGYGSLGWMAENCTSKLPFSFPVTTFAPLPWRKRIRLTTSQQGTGTGRPTSCWSITTTTALPTALSSKSPRI